jgi:Toxin co-regulated pilus biosynthesis protein Q
VLSLPNLDLTISMLRLVLNYAAWSRALAMLLLAASPAMAQVAAPLAPDSEWRSAPKPQLRPEVKQYIAVNPSVPAEGAEWPVWSLEVSDTTLSNTLSRWSRQVKWQLLWEADRDFPILANVYLKGSFESAILSVMQSLSDSDYPLQAIINMDTQVIRIVRYMQSPNG